MTSTTKTDGTECGRTSDASNTNARKDVYKRQGTDTVNKALGAVPNITYREIARYDTAGSYTWVPPYAGTFVFLLIGAGGSGSAAVGYSSNRNRAVGGSSGYAKCVKASLPTNTDVTVFVGQGGAAVTANGADGGGVASKDGNNGGTTSIKLFYPTVAVVGVEGGGGGEAIDTGDIFPSSLNTGAQIGGIPNAYYGPDGLQGASDIDGYWFGIPWTCVNPVTAVSYTHLADYDTKWACICNCLCAGVLGWNARGNGGRL